MADLLIRNIPEETKKALQTRAARNGRSQQTEALSILEASLGNPSKSWVARLREAAVQTGGFSLELPERHKPRDLDTPLWE